MPSALNVGNIGFESSIGLSEMAEATSGPLFEMSMEVGNPDDCDISILGGRLDDQREMECREVLADNSETESDITEYGENYYNLRDADFETSDLQNVCLTNVSLESEETFGEFSHDRLETADYLVNNDNSEFHQEQMFDMDENVEVNIGHNLVVKQVADSITTPERFEGVEDLNDRTVEGSNQSTEIVSHVIQIVLQKVFQSSASNSLTVQSKSRSFLNLKRNIEEFSCSTPKKQSRNEETIENIEEFIHDGNNNLKTHPIIPEALISQDRVSVINLVSGPPGYSQFDQLASTESSRIDVGEFDENRPENMTKFDDDPIDVLSEHFPSYSEKQKSDCLPMLLCPVTGSLNYDVDGVQ
eukprot:GFUD01003059.1.p1 GENE.GFUD01003059.1~~GFUD01003059.1.p1  ORF type:complete len:357 (+),score=83.22 GFUD01003059.1:479-1549(+)